MPAGATGPDDTYRRASAREPVVVGAEGEGRKRSASWGSDRCLPFGICEGSGFGAEAFWISCDQLAVCGLFDDDHYAMLGLGVGCDGGCWGP